ncbi:MAG: ATP-dependent zinc metalloprotease FtsH [Acidimicrobiales bacterium]|nr:ATP-dependent zinc metalloprotease FtsH [Acidimicrobiales bacterium]
MAIGAVLLASLFLSSWLFRADSPEDLTLDEFRTELQDGNVETAEIKDRDNEVRGELRDGTEYVAVYPTEFADELTDEIANAEPPVELSVDQQQESFWISLAASLLPILLLVGVFVFVMSQMQGGGGRVMKFGKAKTKKVDSDQPSVTFADVAGADEAVEELQEIKDFLKSPAKFQALGAKIPKGVLLFGPPGTGKTLLARAVAGEADAPFFSISGSDFVEMFVGVGASRVRDLFEQGKKNAPCIIFIDEIDAVGRHRGAGLGGGHDEREQTLNQLLVEMDGFESNDGVILIAATNRPDVLDPALLRPGRFDRRVVVSRPDVGGREGILQVHTRKIPLSDDVDISVLARATPGFSGADLANLVNEAALLAARHNQKSVTMHDFESSKDKVLMGAERRSLIITEEEKKVTAFHEAGHALLAAMLPHTDPLHKVTIIPRGMALGLTQQLPTEERHNWNRDQLESRIAVCMGGRIAEEVVFGQITTGAQNDIEQATEMARKMVCEWGMSEELGPLTYGKKEEAIFLGREFNRHQDYSENTALKIDAEVKRIVSEQYDRALTIITEQKERLVAVAEALLEHEVLDAPQIQQLLRGEKLGLRVKTPPAAAEPPREGRVEPEPDRLGSLLTPPPVAHPKPSA